MTRPPAAIVFDIGNVLVEWHPERIYDPLIGETARRHLLKVVGVDAMNLSIDAGAPFAQTIADFAAAHPEHAALIRMWDSHWGEMFAPEISGSVAALRALRRRGVPVFALSNFGDESFARAESMYPVLREFDARFISAHLRALKPDPEIYAVLERETGYAGAELFFTDDKPENVAAAEARGWRGHLFEGAEGLVARLVAEGVLEPGDI